MTARSPIAIGLGLCAALATHPVLAAKPSKGKKGAGAKAAPAKTSTPRPDIKHWTLPNGLEALFLADRRAPVVTVQVYYHTGSKDEKPGLRGIAHMFEHMMFKGSKNLRAEDHARYLDRVGGTVNAFTMEDITGYHDTLPREQLGFAMQLESERMRNLLLTQGTVSSEREVVKEEKRLRIDSNPIGKTLERFRQITFTKHPYSWTPAGFLEDLDRVTPKDCQDFYDTYYVPNNATLIVVGDVSEDDVRKLAEQTFGTIPRGKDVPRVTVEEPKQTAMREETLRMEAQIPVLIGGYHMPPAASPDTAALEVLQMVLSGGESSRMHQRLVRKEKLVLAAGGFAEAMEHPGLFLIFAAHLPGKDQAKIKATLLEEIEKVRKEELSAKELEKARNQLTMQYVSKLASADGIAMALGTAQYIEGGWQRFPDAQDRYLKVTAADVKRVAQQYLDKSNLTLVTLEPGSPAAKGGAK